jgi:hypothetical protein
LGGQLRILRASGRRILGLGGLLSATTRRRILGLGGINGLRLDLINRLVNYSFAFLSLDHFIPVRGIEPPALFIDGAMLAAHGPIGTIFVEGHGQIFPLWFVPGLASQKSDLADLPMPPWRLIAD